MINIGPITSDRKRAKIAVYDLEWLPVKGRLPLRMIGVRTEAGYRAFFDVESFLNWALTPKHHGTRFYAHAGGLADIMFLLGSLISRDDLEMSGVTSGSSMIILSIRRGRYRWVFVDSYWTLRDKLAKIGKSIGMEKGDCEFDAPLGMLKDYNQQDCEILYQALSRFEDELWALGGELKPTLASCAMMLFRRSYLDATMSIPGELNDTLRDGYFGGRTEVYRWRTEEPCDYYDLNSCYPYAMTFDLPGSYIGSGRRITACSWVDATVKTSGYCPPLPYKTDALYFPVGTMRGWYYSEELDQSGVEIVEVHNVLKFQPQHHMKGFVDDLYGKRKAAQDDFTKLVLKLLMNSLYGKLGERREKQKVIFNPSAEWLSDSALIIRDELSAGLEPSRKRLMPGVYTEDTIADIAHEHVALCASVTALARKELRKYMHQGKLYYCDTDSVIASQTHILTTDALGGMKFETHIPSGEFAAPKVYRINDQVKAKGFPLRSVAEQLAIQPLLALSEDEAPDTDYPAHKITTEAHASKDLWGSSPTLRLEVYRRIKDGETMHFRSMDRAVTQLKRPTGPGGMPEATERGRTKALRAIARGKRAANGHNDTRPWDVSELE